MRNAVSEFPKGRDFLKITQDFADACSKATESFEKQAGERLPKTIHELGTTLSIIYRLACCYYGCRGGDHQVEWLIGKLTNQAVAAYTLTRIAQYDEALMLIRGIGEIVNLVWLFNEDKDELAAWRSADKRTRTKRFGPSVIRQRLKSLPIGPPIDDKRYAMLCEIGTHPTPGLPPGHYTGTGRPILGAIVQPLGIFACINELAYAIAMTVPVSQLLNADSEIRIELKTSCVNLLRTIGSITILNYEEKLRAAPRAT